MIHSVLGLAFAVFGVSLLQFLRHGRRHGLSAYLYLFWCHLIVGMGYLFIPAYRTIFVRDRYPGWEHVELDEAGAISLLVICLSLLLASLWLNRRSELQHVVVECRRSKLNVMDCVLFCGFAMTYALAVFCGTLRVGSDLHLVLPYRLNGIIEVTCRYLLPIWMAFYIHRAGISFHLGLLLIGAYGLANLLVFGSKFNALFPVVCFVTVQLAMGTARLNRLACAGFVILLFYVAINPYYFRGLLREQERVGFLQSVSQSRQSVLDSRENAFSGVRNMAIRITGVLPMQEAIDDAGRSYGRTVLPQTLTMPSVRYNTVIHPTREGWRCATGYFGFFIILLGSHTAGLFVAIFLQFITLFILRRYDEWAQRRQSVFLMVGLTCVMLLYPLLIDGNLDKSEGYLHLLFGVATSYMIARYVLATRRTLPRVAQQRTPYPEEGPYEGFGHRSDGGRGASSIQLGRRPRA